MEADGDIYGDGVNVAARLEQLADPGGVCISGAVYEHTAGKVPVHFESRGEQQVKNLARPVRVYALVGTTPARVEPKALPLPRQAIHCCPAVHEHERRSRAGLLRGRDHRRPADCLSRIRWLFVIARNSTFVFKGKAVDVKEIGKQLGVRYVLEGSVRKAGNRVRVSGQLIEAATGAHIWTDRYDRNLTDIFELQDDITGSVVAAIEPSLLHVEMARARAKRTESS